MCHAVAMSRPSAYHPPARSAKRKRNYTDAESSLIIQFVVENFDALHNIRGHNMSVGARQAMWQDLTSMVNAQSIQPRTVAEVKKRWQDEKRRVKAKILHSQLAASLPVGSVAPPEALTADERAVASVIRRHSIYGLGILDHDAPPQGLSAEDGLLDGPSTSEGQQAPRRVHPLVLQAIVSKQEDSDGEDYLTACHGASTQMPVTASHTSGRRQSPVPISAAMDMFQEVSCKSISDVLVEAMVDPGDEGLVDLGVERHSSPSPAIHIANPDPARVGHPPHSTDPYSMTHRGSGAGINAGLDTGKGDWEQDFFLQQEAAQDSLNSIEGAVDRLAQEMGWAREGLLGQTTELLNIAGAIQLGQEEMRTLLAQQHQEMVGLYTKSLETFGRIATAVERYVDFATSSLTRQSAPSMAAGSQTSPSRTQPDAGTQPPHELPRDTVPRRGRSLRQRGKPRHQRHAAQTE